jgi:hypothetical protein
MTIDTYVEIILLRLGHFVTLRRSISLADRAWLSVYRGQRIGSRVLRLMFGERMRALRTVRRPLLERVVRLDQFGAGHYGLAWSLLSRIRTAPNPHATVIPSERSAPGGPVSVVTWARKNLMLSLRVTTMTSERAPGAGDNACIWLRTTSALLVQSISASLFSSLCA